MSYQTILTAITTKDAPHLEHAINMARELDAHLEVLAFGIDAVVQSYGYGGADAMLQQAALQDAAKSAKELREWAEERMKRSGLRFDVHGIVALRSAATEILANYGRFADLMVLAHPGDKSGTENSELLLEGALFLSDTPVIVAPKEVPEVTLPKRVVIGWNDSAPSLKSLKASLPLLQAAEIVYVTIIDPPIHSADRSDPGGMVSQFLVRHGVPVEITVLAKTQPRIGDILMQHAETVDADMIVSGAYGHTRFREALIGGATRRMLANAKLPLFMAH